ncbi:MAG: hypothetical protein EOM20_11180, partial [Spartobacteria bacterium]|nr:hypothetical protein [Spartobacteria bacterium]
MGAARIRAVFCGGRTAERNILSRSFFIWAALCALPLCGAVNADAALPFQDDFESGLLATNWTFSSAPQNMVLRGSAGVYDEVLQLTEAWYAQGSAWHIHSLPIDADFSSRFIFRIGRVQEWAQDGMAFVLQADGPTALPAYAWAGPGYANLTNAVAVEFDTDWRAEYEEPEGQHLAILAFDGSLASYHHTNALAVSTNIPLLNDGTIHTAIVAYVDGTLHVYLNDESMPVISAAIDLSAPAALNTNRAWIGFTAQGGQQSCELLSWSFEGGGESFLYDTFTNYRGRVSVTNAFDPIQGSYHAVLDNAATNPWPTLNNLELALDGSGHSNIWLRYRFRQAGEAGELPSRYDGFTEGIGASASADHACWFRLDNVPSYGGVSNGTAEHWVFLDDVGCDTYSGQCALKSPSNLYVRFQQYGVGPWPDEGLVLDEVRVFEGSLPVGQFPFEDGFETGIRHSFWQGNYDITTDPHSGTYGLRFLGREDHSLILTMDLEGRTNAWLNFWCRNYDDVQDDVVLPQCYTNHVRGDGVMLSVDGTHWYKVLGLTTNEGSPADDTYHLFNASLDAVFANHGLTAASNTQIKFQFATRVYNRRYLDDVAVLSQQITWSAQAYYTEEAHILGVTAVRKGGAEDVVTVDYTTLDGTAVAGEDYAAATGTLTFGVGVYTQTVSIAIHDDTNYYETAETFSITLSNPGGGVELGAPSSAIIHIAADARAALPVVEGFEGEIADYWTREGRNNGYYVCYGTPLYPHTGERSLLIISYYTNDAYRAVLKVNLEDQEDIVLKFWHRTMNTNDAVMPEVFSHAASYDGVAVSTNGATWYKARGLTMLEGETTNYALHTISLDDVVAAHGLGYTKNFRIGFQSMDGFVGMDENNGSYFDDVAVFRDYGVPEILTPALAPATSMIYYAVQFTATNGVPPYIWSTTSALPTGVTFSPDGRLSGLPEDEEVFPLDVRLLDGASSVSNRTYTLEVIANDNRPPFITDADPGSPIELPENGAQEFSVSAQDPEAQPLHYTWTWDDVPFGVSTNRIERTTAWGDAGDYTLVVRISDGLWSNLTASWAITITDDNDHDGMPNAWELLHGFDPWSAHDADEDADGDHLTNLEEYLHNTDPRDPDMDGDSLPDGFEIMRGLCPTSTIYEVQPVLFEHRHSLAIPGVANNMSAPGNLLSLSIGSRIALYSIANPALPLVRGTVDTSNAWVYAQMPLENPAYLCVTYGVEGLRVFNIANPWAPFEADLLDTPGSALNLARYGDWVYLTDYGEGLGIYDLQTPTNPVAVNTITNDPLLGGLFVHGDTLYHAGFGSKLYSRDLAIPTNPPMLGSINIIETTGIGVWSNLLLVSDRGNGVCCINVSDPSNMVLLDTAPLPADSYVYGMQIAHGYAFVNVKCFADADERDRIHVYDLNDPENLVFCGAIRSQTNVSAFIVVSNYLYVSWNVGNKLDTCEIFFRDLDRDGMLDSWEQIYGGPDGLDPYGDEDDDGILNIGEFRAGLDPLDPDQNNNGLPDGIDIRLGGDPTAPCTLNQLTLVGQLDTDGMAYDVLVAGAIAYIADGTNGLVIADVSDPSAPSQMAHALYSGGHRAVDLAKSGDRLFYADTTGGVVKVNVADPNAPVGVMRYLPSGGPIPRVAVQSNLLCATTPDSFSSVI